jgi:hypothetical protein
LRPWCSTRPRMSANAPTPSISTPRTFSIPPSRYPVLPSYEIPLGAEPQLLLLELVCRFHSDPAFFLFRSRTRVPPNASNSLGAGCTSY